MIENTWEENGQSGEHCLKKKKATLVFLLKMGLVKGNGRVQLMPDCMRVN